MEHHRPCDWTSLTSFGVSGAFSDPTLEIHDGSGNTIATNDDWKEAQQVQIEATGLPPADDREAAIWATLPVGATLRLFEARPERLDSLWWKSIAYPECVSINL